MFEALRSYQTLFGEAREKAVKAISFAKLVRKDLEVSAEFSLRDSSIDPFHLMKRLEETNHVKVLLPNCDLQIFVPLCISNHQDCVLHLLDMHCGQTTSHIIHAKGFFYSLVSLKRHSYNLHFRISCVSRLKHNCK